jgi:hypothetical protein
MAWAVLGELTGADNPRGGAAITYDDTLAILSSLCTQESDERRFRAPERRAAKRFSSFSRRRFPTFF